MNHSQKEGLVTPRPSLVKDCAEPNTEVFSPHPCHWHTRTGEASVCPEERQLCGDPRFSLGFSLQVDEVTDLLASFTSLSLQMQGMEKR